MNLASTVVTKLLEDYCTRVRDNVVAFGKKGEMSVSPVTVLRVS